jgi:hypothetical protein
MTVMAKKNLISKGTESRDGYFFKGLNIFISTGTFCVCAENVQGLSTLNSISLPYEI